MISYHWSELNSSAVPKYIVGPSQCSDPGSGLESRVQTPDWEGIGVKNALNSGIENDPDWEHWF